jgi:hypothetical protein
MSLHCKTATSPEHRNEPNVGIERDASGWDGRTGEYFECNANHGVFIEALYSDVSILVHQLRHLQSFYRTLVTALDICEENNARIIK